MGLRSQGVGLLVCVAACKLRRPVVSPLPGCPAPRPIPSLGVLGAQGAWVRRDALGVGLGDLSNKTPVVVVERGLKIIYISDIQQSNLLFAPREFSRSAPAINISQNCFSSTLGRVWLDP